MFAAAHLVASGLAPRWSAKRSPSSRRGLPDKPGRQPLGPLRSPTRGKPARHRLFTRHSPHYQLTAQPTGLDHACFLAQARHQKFTQPGKTAVALHMQQSVELQRLHLPQARGELAPPYTSGLCGNTVFNVAMPDRQRRLVNSVNARRVSALCRKHDRTSCRCIKVVRGYTAIHSE